MNIRIILNFIMLVLLSVTLLVCNTKKEKNDNNMAIAAVLLSSQNTSSSTIQVSTLSLSESGKDSKSILNQPEDLAVDSNGIIYVADSKNNRVIKVVNESTVSTILSSNGNSSDVSIFNNPEGITAGPNGIVFVSNTGSSTASNGYFEGHNIIKIDTNNNNTISLFSGKDKPSVRETIDGSNGTNRYFKPEGIRYANNKLVIGEAGGYNVREVNISNGTITTLAGEKPTGGSSPTGGTPIATDGLATTAKFNGPKGVIADSDGNVYIVDKGNHCIRKYNPSTKQVSTFAGSDAGGDSAKDFIDGKGTAARFNSPYMITLDESGNFYVADSGNFAIRKITKDGTVSTIAGGKGKGREDGSTTSAKFYNPIGIYYNNKTLYITDVASKKIAEAAADDYSTIRKITGL
ncbi:MAG: hypothetical protein H7A25_17560 [Leptospiraceae bacterium]|nr:hypothetical protein [Leptospiraceae bacterium]